MARCCLSLYWEGKLCNPVPAEMVLLYRVGMEGSTPNLNSLDVALIRAQAIWASLQTQSINLTSPRGTRNNNYNDTRIQIFKRYQISAPVAATLLSCILHTIIKHPMFVPQGHGDVAAPAGEVGAGVQEARPPFCRCLVPAPRRQIWTSISRIRQALGAGGLADDGG